MLYQLFFEPLVFLLAIIVCFYIPGTLIFVYLKQKLALLEDAFLSLTIGILVFTLTAYIAAWIYSWKLLIPLLIGSAFLFYKQKLFPKKIQIKKFKQKMPVLLLLTLFSVLFSIPMITSGQFGNTYFLHGVNNGDGIWHLQLIQEMKNHFPPDIPGFANVPLTGYHFFYNFLLATISNIFLISPASLLFRYFPLLIAFLWAFGVYTLMKSWIGNIGTSIIAVFLTMFGGNFVWIMWLYGHKDLALDSGFGMLQPATSLLNPPFAISIVILTAFLYCLYKHVTTNTKAWLIPIMLCAGMVAMFKIYAAMIILSGVAIACLFALIKKQYHFFLACLGVGLLLAITYIPFAEKNAGLLYSPFWAPHKILVDNLPWYGYAEKQYTYSQQSVIKGLVEIEVYAMKIFFIGNLGTRTIGILLLPFFWMRKRKNLSPFAWMITGMALFSILIPLLFLQTGKVYEIIQLTWYFLFFCSLFAALGFGELFSRKFPIVIKVITIVFLIAITLPSSIVGIGNYVLAAVSAQPSINSIYTAATEFLRNQGYYDDTVLELPTMSGKINKQSLQSWYQSEMPRVTAFVNKRGYVQFVNHTFQGVDLDKRLSLIQKILLTMQTNRPPSEKIKQSLQDEDIIYIFSRENNKQIEKLGYKKIFSNAEATIYRKVVSK